MTTKAILTAVSQVNMHNSFPQTKLQAGLHSKVDLFIILTIVMGKKNRIEILEDIKIHAL